MLSYSIEVSRYRLKSHQNLYKTIISNKTKKIKECDQHKICEKFNLKNSQVLKITAS